MIEINDTNHTYNMALVPCDYSLFCLQYS